MTAHATSASALTLAPSVLARRCSDVVYQHMGLSGQVLLDLAVIVNCGGMMVCGHCGTCPWALCSAVCHHGPEVL